MSRLRATGIRGPKRSLLQIRTLTTLSGEGAKDEDTGLLVHSTDTGAMVAVITLTDATQTTETVTALLPYQLQHTVPVLPDFTEGGDTLYYRVRTVTGSGATEKTSPYGDPENIKIVDNDVITDGVRVETTGIQFTPPITAPRLASDGRCISGKLMSSGADY